MAKKAGSARQSRADAVLQAVDQAFQTQAPREKIVELVEELSQTAGRLRGAVDELRPASAEELKALRADLRALSRRVEALEGAPPKRAPAKRAAPKKPAGSRSTAAKAGAARRAASERSTGRRSSTTKRTSS